MTMMMMMMIMMMMMMMNKKSFKNRVADQNSQPTNRRNKQPTFAWIAKYVFYYYCGGNVLT